MTQETMLVGDYQEFVTSTIYMHEATDWERMHARLMNEELFEVLVQHGNAAMMLWPQAALEQWDGEGTISLEHRYGLLDELMDLTWFNMAAAERMGLQAVELCRGSLERHTGTKYDHIETVDQLEQVIAGDAAAITVPNKLSIMGFVPENDPRGFTSLEDNPLYLLLRTIHRVTRALQQRTEDMTAGGPPVATELEDIVESGQAIGDALNVLFYVIHERFGWRVVDAMMYNATKLTERRTWGKPSGSKVE